MQPTKIDHLLRGEDLAELLDDGQMIELLGLSNMKHPRRALQRLCRDRSNPLPHVSLGRGQRRYPRRDVAQWIKRNTVHGNGK